jgi:prepilin-type processing-associated H-X9-DG protein
MPHRRRLIAIAFIVTCSVAASWATWDRIGYALFGNSGCGSPSIKCASQLRQIGIALQIYSNNNGKHYPPSFDALLDDGLSTEMFVCSKTLDERAIGPTTQAVIRDFQKPGHNSYVYVAAGASDQSNSSTFVLAYEPIGHHGPGTNILYGDGHVAYVTRPEAARVLSELQSGFNPPRPPSTQPSIR